MSDDSVLSKDEIDALLTSGEADEDHDGDQADDVPRGVRTVDFREQFAAATGRLPFVEAVNEKFARRFRTNLASAMRMSFSIQVGGTQVLTYRELTQQLRSPIGLLLFDSSPFTGVGFIGLDADLVYQMVDHYYGGRGGSGSADGRGFTSTERRLISKIHDLLLEDLQGAWRELIEVNYVAVGGEFNPSLVSEIAPSELLVVNPFKLEFVEAGGGAEFRYALPLQGLEPYRRSLDSAAGVKHMPNDPEWAEKLSAALYETTLRLSCCVAETQLRLGRLLELQAGDVLPVTMPPEHLVRVEGRRLFTARLGDANGHLALEYLDPVQETL